MRSDNARGVSARTKRKRRRFTAEYEAEVVEVVRESEKAIGEKGLAGLPRRTRKTTQSDDALPIAPNVVARASSRSNPPRVASPTATTSAPVKGNLPRGRDRLCSRVA